VPAHDGDAEHAWKDGDSWRRGGGDNAIENALMSPYSDVVGGRGGVSGTGPGGLRAIMEAPRYNLKR